MTVVEKLDELQVSSVGRRECSSTRQRKGARRMDVHVDTCSQPCSRATGCGHSQGSGVCAALCIRRTLCRHVMSCNDWYTNGHFLLFDCLLTVSDEWYTVPIVKNTQNHWCTNRHRSTKTVPTVYQSSKAVKNRQKTVKTAQK